MAQVQSGGRWPYQSWQFWCGLLVGAGIGLMLGAALVEADLLTPHSKAWCSVLGILLIGGGGAVAWQHSKRV
ncbi:MAG TPA: hypothetical protein VGP76_03350 [Planctomycetaceae bacterium]|nr:hypothetical protein [Planctomycetaceae bacterium]